MNFAFASADSHSRRHFLAANSMGLGGLALAWLLKEDGLLAAPAKPETEPRTFDLKARPPHHAPRAQAMISLFMQGGPSHIDLLEPKPVMAGYHGKTYPGTVNRNESRDSTTNVMASPWKFKAHGQSGLEVSELLPHLGEVVDDICILRSMHTPVNAHEASVNALNNGQSNPGRPVLGSWLTYALGAPGQNLPAYVALPDETVPVGGIANWTNGFLPSLYQGTVVRMKEPRILNLDPPAHLKGAAQQQYLAYLEGLNRRHLTRNPGQTDLEARIASYELAARMQTAARQALDLSQESAATRRMYGLNDRITRDYGERCLIARRLVERGVRFVQVFTRGQFWDHHTNIRSRLPEACRKTDQPAAALIKDLKQRGLLDTTLVHWGGEMGRLPVSEFDAGPQKAGRGHNTHGFSMWLAGGGIKGGLAYGATDDFGHRAAVNRVSHHDYHATVLHLFGLDPQKVVYSHNGREQSLLDGQPGRVVSDILTGGGATVTPIDAPTSG